MSSAREIKSNAAYVACAAGVALSLVSGALYVWSIFVAPLEALYGWQRADSSLVFTLLIIFFSFGMSSGGMLLQRLGPRWTVLLGAMLVLGGFQWAATGGLWAFCLGYGIMAGYGMGMVNIAPAAVCLRWFPGQSGLVCGTLAMAVALGTFLFGSCLAHILLRTLGITQTIQILGILLAGLVCVGSVFLRYPPPVPATQNTTPLSGIALSAMLQTSAFWQLWGWAFTLQIGGLMIVGHVAPYALEHNASAAQSAAAMAVYAMANGAGRLLFGWILDRQGPRTAMTLAALAMTLGLGLLLALTPLWGLLGLFPAVAILAMAFGSTIPLMSAMVMRLFGQKHMGANMGFGSTSLMAAGIVGPYAGGLIRQNAGSYASAIAIAAAAALVGLWLALRLTRQPEVDSEESDSSAPALDHHA